MINTKYFCKKCNIFVPGTLNLSGKNIKFSGCKTNVPCPQCGGELEIPDGSHSSGWNELNFTSNEEVYNSLSTLATVASRNKNESAGILGTAFALSSFERNSLYMTAAHVIEEGFKNSSHYSERKNARRMSHIPSPEDEKFKLINEWIKNTEDLWCLVAQGNKLVQCPVIGACLRPPLDMALLVLDTSHLKEKIPVLQINSDLLEVGDEIIYISTVTEGGTRTLVGRHGFITEVISYDRLVNAPMYKTNIPIEAGASGGPVFRHLGHFNGGKEVIGVVSSDISPQEAFKNPSIDGNSSVSVICSAAPLDVSGTDGKILTFKDMCSKNIINDVGTYLGQVQLTYSPDRHWVQSFPTQYPKNET